MNVTFISLLMYFFKIVFHPAFSSNQHFVFFKYTLKQLINEEY